jgi:ribonucleoside-triphosphate reductase (thioredoxin)
MTRTTLSRANGHTRHVFDRTAEEISAEWQCRKRTGKTVPFDCGTIRSAVERCFTTVGLVTSLPNGITDQANILDNIVKGVVNSLWASAPPTGHVCADVEDVQRQVIAQLWANGLYEAAEHYQNYREERRKARAQRKVSPETEARFDEMRKHFPTDLQIYQFMSKFSRWREVEGRRETWKEAVYERVIPWLLKQAPPGALRDDEIKDLYEFAYDLKASPAMRVVQMAGPALDRCHVGVYNCAYAPVCDIKSFAEALYILMQGSGHGFSVESDYVSELPRIKKQRGLPPVVIVVEDTTESWCDSYLRALELLWDGYDVELDTTRVRAKGSVLRTKGGRASGPGPLRELIDFARNLIKSRQGSYLRDIDAHRLMCFTGRIVQMGGVRRAAMLSLSDLTSLDMRNAKSGSWYDDGAGVWYNGRYLSMANNSAAYDLEGVPVPVKTFMAEWSALVNSDSGERGIFNRQAALKHRPLRRKAAKFGCNPCAEIILRPFEFCNLSIAIARKDDTRESLEKKVRVAAYYGKLQSLCTKFGYLRDEWRQNCEEERLLGVDINGHADCPLLHYGAPGREEMIARFKEIVREVDIDLSKRFGVGESPANTTIKPSGDSAVFFDCGSGISARFSEFQDRWVREMKDSPVSKFLIDSGVPYADAPENEENYVFRFTRQAPAGSVLRDDMTAEQQFFNWLAWKRNWSEHSVSATIYVEPHEWPRLGMLVYEHIDEITGLAFLPKDNGSYTYSPNIEITEEEFKERVATFPKLNWAKLTEYEDDDQTGSRQTLACTGPGGCEV